MKKRIELLDPEINLSSNNKYLSRSITLPIKSGKDKDFLDALTLLVTNLDNGKEALPKLVESIDYDRDFTKNFFLSSTSKRVFGIPLLRICVELKWKIKTVKNFLKENLQHHSKYHQNLINELESESCTSLFFSIFYNRLPIHVIDYFIKNHRTLELFSALNTPLLFIDEMLKNETFIEIMNDKNLDYTFLESSIWFRKIKYLVMDQIDYRNSSSGITYLIRSQAQVLYNTIDNHRKRTGVEISEDSIYTFIAVFYCALGVKGYPKLKSIELMDQKSGSQSFYIKYRTKIRDLLKPVFEENRKRGF